MKRNKPGTYTAETHFATTHRLDTLIREYSRERNQSYNQSVNDLVSSGFHLSRPLPKKFPVDDRVITDGISSALNFAAEQDDLDLERFINHTRYLRTALRDIQHTFREKNLLEGFEEYEPRSLNYTVRPHFKTTPRVEEKLKTFSEENNLSYSQSVNYMIELGLRLRRPTPKKYLLNDEKIRVSLSKLSIIGSRIESEPDFENVLRDLDEMAVEFSNINKILDEGGLRR